MPRHWLGVGNHQTPPLTVLLEQAGEDDHAGSSDYAHCISRQCCKHSHFEFYEIPFFPQIGLLKTLISLLLLPSVTHF